MTKNKGRLVPNLHTLQYFSEEDARSPFEGELCEDRDTSDIYFWSKNANNVWTKNSRTANIRKVLDNYGTSGDNTFQNAQAFYDSGVIHRFFFSQFGQKVWLDRSVDTSKFAYYAIKSIALDKGLQRYITGFEDSDGSDHIKALIPLSADYGKLTKEVKLNTWYIVEFYDKNKELRHSINYLSYQSTNMPIDLKTEEGINTNTITNVSIGFNKTYKDNVGYIYKNGSVFDLEISVILTMADGHQVIVPSTSDSVTLYGVNDIDTTLKGSYKIRADYKVFSDSDEASTAYKTFSDVVTYLASEEQKKGMTFKIQKANSDRHDRNYKTIKVRGLGSDYYTVVNDYVVDTERSDLYDYVTIPSSYFKIEKNTVSISYTEKSDSRVVSSKSLNITAYATVDVIEPPTFRYSKFIPVGYVYDNNGSYEVKYKFFILNTNGIIQNIPDEDVTIYLPSDYRSGQLNRITVSFYSYTETFFSYFRDINLTGAVRRVLTSTNQSDLAGSPDTSRKPLLIYSTSDSTFTIGEGTFDKSFTSSFAALSSLISEDAEYIRVKSVKDSIKTITDFVNTDKFTYTPYFREYAFLKVKKETTVQDAANTVKNIPNYGKTYRLIKYKNFTVTNTGSNPKTLEEALQVLDKPTDDFGIFIGYSINNSGVLTESEKGTIIKAGKSLHIFALFANTETTNSTVIPANFGGLLETTYTLNKINVKPNDPFLVEGYSVDSNGKYRCLGAIVCHASNSI